MFRAVLPEEAEQILGEQDTQYLVPVAADDGEAGVSGLYYRRQNLVEVLVDIDDDHVRTRHHDVTNLGLGHLEHACQHALLFGIEVDLGLLDKLLDLFAAPGITLDRALDACEQSGVSRAARTWRFVVHCTLIVPYGGAQ